MKGSRFQKGTTGYLMSRIKSVDTKPEIVVRRFLFSKGCRYRVHVNSLPGKPDIVFLKHKIAIFVHGCFWHAHKNCKTHHIPRTNSEYWSRKFSKNVTR